MRRFVLVTLAGAATLAAGPGSVAAERPPGQSHDFEIRVLSSPASMVTGGDALVQVSIPKNVPPRKTTVTLNGVDITGTLTYDARADTRPGWSPASCSEPTRSTSTRTEGARAGRPPT